MRLHQKEVTVGCLMGAEHQGLVTPEGQDNVQNREKCQNAKSVWVDKTRKERKKGGYGERETESETEKRRGRRVKRVWERSEARTPGLH